MFDEPKTSRLLGFMLLLHLDCPRTIPDFSKYVTSDGFGGFAQYLVKRETNEAFVPPEYREEIVSHQLNPQEVAIYQAMRTVFKALCDRVKESKATGDVVGTRKYSSYKLALITYLRQALICPLIPVTKMYCDMGDFKIKSELSDMLTKCLQTAGIDEYLNDEANIVSSRFESVLEKVASHPSERCIIFSTFRTVTDLLMHYISTRFGREVITICAKHTVAQRQETIERFEKSTNAVLAIPYDIGAEGLNLQCASVVFLTDLWWNSAKTNQAIGRAFRPGQQAPVVQVYIFVADTLLEREIISKSNIKAAILSDLETGKTTLQLPKIDMAHLHDIILATENVDTISKGRHAYHKK
jgi:SNF2 family DNA or RNA helicase